MHSLFCLVLSCICLCLAGRGPGDEDGNEEELPDLGRYRALDQLEGSGQQELRRGAPGTQGHGMAVLGGTEAQAGGGLRRDSEREEGCMYSSVICQNCKVFVRAIACCSSFPFVLLFGTYVGS